MSQRGLVERMLREMGNDGVSNHSLIYTHGITRAAAIIHELRQDGWSIETRQHTQRLQDGRVPLAHYILRAEPGRPAVAPQARRMVPADTYVDLPEPSPLTFPCGCVRSADGRDWLERCYKHMSRPTHGSFTTETAG